MYTGINRKRNEIILPKKIDEFQLLTEVEDEKNGFITKKLEFKTKKFEADKTITWKDFEINNLIAAGIDPTTLKTTTLGINLEDLATKAQLAENELDTYQIIKDLTDGTTNE